MLEKNKIYLMDCLNGLREMEDDSVDCMVTDPPYGLSFMGKRWDKAVPSVDVWSECLRVLKPGGFAFVLCIPRSDCQSRMIVNLEDAGFQLNFTPVYWCYASGFPKALNIGKVVDKKLGAEREVIGRNPNSRENCDKNNTIYESGTVGKTDYITKGCSDLEGSYAGFQPKPAVEVILVAMKPLSEHTYVAQALCNRKGVTWLDDCRIPYDGEGDLEGAKFGTPYGLKNYREENERQGYDRLLKIPTESNPPNKCGRFPANLLVSDDVLDDGRITTSKKAPRGGTNPNPMDWGNIREDGSIPKGHTDSGSFSRYFSLDKWADRTFPFLIVPKASKGEKNKGLEGLEEKEAYNLGHKDNPGRKAPEKSLPRANYHPTVKPIKLMSYLITLGSREGDLILDPFMGSGTTAVSARLLNRNFIGFELSEEYYKIAEARIRYYLRQRKLNEEEIK